MSIRTPKPLLPLLLIALLSACGGGSGGGAPVPDDGKDIIATPSCPEGPASQCSGETILTEEHGVTLTESGVHAYGESTSDLTRGSTAAETINAYGLRPASGGEVEVRVARATDGKVTDMAILLDNLGISWDARKDRPLIIETFMTMQGRMEKNPDGTLSRSELRPSANLEFYDYAYKGRDAKQLHYANNAYFPRNQETNPSRCEGVVVTQEDPCPTLEAKGIEYNKNEPAGDWATGGNIPQYSSAQRLHSDGDLYAGDGAQDVPNSVLLPDGGYSLPGDGSTPLGHGTAWPGFKGYRSFGHYSYQYANLTSWFTQDTVEIVELSGGSNEHNKNRRGWVAFGPVTPTVAMPTDNKEVTYRGTAYGWHANAQPANAVNDITSFRGDVSIKVNFSTGVVTVSLPDSLNWSVGGRFTPSNFNATLANSSTLANYATTRTPFRNVSGSMSGGMSVRYFGQNAEEVGGTFTMTDVEGKETAIGGFIARKQ